MVSKQKLAAGSVITLIGIIFMAVGAISFSGVLQSSAPDSEPFRADGCFPDGIYEDYSYTYHCADRTCQDVGPILQDYTPDPCFAVVSKGYTEGDSVETIFHCRHTTGHQVDSIRQATCVNGEFGSELEFGENYVESVLQIYDTRGHLANQWRYTSSVVVAGGGPCVLGPGEFVVFESFDTGDVVSEDALTYEPSKYCSAFQPIVLDQASLTSQVDPEKLNILQDHNSFTVEEGQVVGVWYVTEQPTTIDVVCDEGESYSISSELCIDTIGIITPCHNGFLQEDGTCVVQAEVSQVCEGQLVEEDGEFVCNVFTPIRETLLCTDSEGNTFEVSERSECTQDLELEVELTCDGDQVKIEGECIESTHVKSKEICDDDSEAITDDEGEVACKALVKKKKPLLQLPDSGIAGGLITSLGVIFLVIGITLVWNATKTKRRKRR